MSYKQKYKIKYLESDYIETKKNMTGGGITWATQEYIDNIIKTEHPDLTKCHLIKDVVPKTNEGRNNDGIGFITIEDKEYFLKYGKNLFNEFKTGYMLSKLKADYPYFLNVHSLFKCEYVPSGREDRITYGQVLVVDKGGETIYNYLNRKSLEYILNLIPDLKTRVDELDENITRIINENLTEEEKDYSNWEFERKNKVKYDSIILKVDKLIKSFYLLLSKEIFQFQTEFVPLFLENYKTLIDSYMIVDLFTLNKYNDYISDKKADNFMVTTEPYVENKTHINIKLGSENIKIKNVCNWHNSKEYCFIYPVDFGSTSSMGNPKFDKDLLSYFLNQWIYSFARLTLYSDNNRINLESGNILKLNTNQIKFIFSKFNNERDNGVTQINFNEIFEKYNLFKINIVNPLKIYYDGIKLMVDQTINYKELERLLELNPLKKDDNRFGAPTIKFFNINSLEEACKILQLTLEGNSLRYDTDSHNYMSSGEDINLLKVNGLPQKYVFLSNQNVYKTFIIL